MKWYREAEIMHGRIAQLAVIGILFPSFAHFPGNAETGADAYADTNPLTALSTVPPAALWQIAFAIFCQETNRINKVILGDADAGEHGWGQKGIWNPFNFNYTEEEYREKQVRGVASLGLLWAVLPCPVLSIWSSLLCVARTAQPRSFHPSDRAFLLSLRVWGVHRFRRSSTAASRCSAPWACCSRPPTPARASWTSWAVPSPGRRYKS